MNRTDLQDKSAADRLSGPIILELFTSQGCSSCPSADKLLSRLAHDSTYEGRLIPLAFHVDYWNNLGWKDPYSDGAWTSRQGDYTRALGEATMYTPQLVVQGQTSMVGSNEKAVRKAINEQAGRDASHQFSVSIKDFQRAGARVSVRVLIAPDASVKMNDGVVVAALFENGLSTQVPAGENKGRILKNDFVVRLLKEASKPVGRMADHEMYEISFDISDGWQFNRMGIAVWVQREQTMEIVGADVKLPRKQ